MRACLMTWAAVAAMGAVLALPEPTMAWGPKGHELVGKIADKHLTKQARDAIAELLQGHQFTGLADGRLTNWADAIRPSAFFRKKYPTMAQWHFVDLDVGVKIEEIKLEDLKDKDNALMALRKFQAVLKDPEKSLTFTSLCIVPCATTTRAAIWSELICPVTTTTSSTCTRSGTRTSSRKRWEL
jgi:hypothetical protein